MYCKRNTLIVLAALISGASFAQTILPDLGTGGVAYALNDQGDAVGVVYEPETHLPKPARWNDGVLSVLDVGTFGEALPLNISRDGRFAVGKGGDVFIIPAGTPVLWDETGALRVLPDIGFGGIATAVTDQGVAVGFVYAADQSSRAARWSADGTLELLPGVNPNETFSAALDINSAGYIVGFSSSEPFYQASVKWGSAGLTTLDDAEWNTGRAVAVSESSTSLYVSNSRTSFTQTWFTQRPNGDRTVIQPLDPTLHFTANDVNSADNVVGFGSVPDEFDPIRIRAAIWLGGNPQLLPVPSDLFYSYANSVNESGGVAGALQDTLQGTVVPTIWDPIEGAGVQIALNTAKGRPGQTVRLRAAFRHAGKPQAGVMIRFMNAAQTVIGTARTNSLGFAEVSHTIPANAPVGRSVYMATLNGTQKWHGTVEVLPGLSTGTPSAAGSPGIRVPIRR